MITAAGIEDQELAIAAKPASVNNPTVAGRGNRAAGPGRNREAFLSSARAIGAAEFANAGAVDRQAQPPTQVGKGDCRDQAARIAERSEFRLRCVFDNPAVRITHGALGAVKAGFEFGNQILDRVDLVGEVGGVLPLATERLLGARLFLLPQVNQQCHAQLFAAQQIEFIGELVALRTDLLRTLTRAAMSVARVSACTRISGTTAPRVIAARTARKASSGLTSKAGGWRPTRWRAAMISTMTAWRRSSDLRSNASCWLSVSSRV